MINSSKVTPSLESSVTDTLRFPLIIGVLFIHNAIPYNPINFSVSSTLSLFLSQIISRVSVPLFFFFAGYYFFFKTTAFNTAEYGKKLSKRFYSLFIPYLFWNSLMYFFYFASSKIPFLLAFSKKSNGFSILDWLTCLWSYNNGFPIAPQFWFIRDLIVVIVISPVIYILLHRNNWMTLVFLFALWISNFIQMPNGLSLIALAFFSFGAYFSVNHYIFLSYFNSLSNISYVTYPILVVLDFWTNGNIYNIIIHNCAILVGTFFFVNLTTAVCSRVTVKSRFWADVSFFVFASHEPLMTVLRKLIYKIVPVYNDYVSTVLYFVIVIMVSVITILLYYVLKLYMPRFTKIVTGNR